MFGFKTPICCLLLLLSALSPLRAEPSARLEAELEEMQIVVRALRAENEQLRERNRMLTDEVLRLRRLLTEPVETLPNPRANPRAATLPDPRPWDPDAAPLLTRPSPPPTVEEPEPAPPPGFDIIYVNPNWHYVIFDGGTDDDLATGNRGRIMREGVEIGQATITAVKPGQSVADLDLQSFQGRGQYPRERDRMLFLPSETTNP